jgi:hypothetical protein
MAADQPVRTPAKAHKKCNFNLFIGFKKTDKMSRSDSTCQRVMGENGRFISVFCQTFFPDLPSGELPMAEFRNQAYCLHYFPLVLSRTTTRGVINLFGGV